MRTPFHERLREAMTGTTNRAVAGALDVREGTVSEWVNGHKEPTLQNFIDLADHLRVSLDYLAGRVDEPRAVFASDDAQRKLDVIRGLVTPPDESSDHLEDAARALEELRGSDALPPARAIEKPS